LHVNKSVFPDVFIFIKRFYWNFDFGFFSNMI